MKLLFFFAKRFVAGETLKDVLAVARAKKKKGISSTLDHLGEDVVERKKALEATKTYIKILDGLYARKALGAHISIKLSQLGLAIDKKLALKHAEMIVKRGKRHHIMVEIDMEGSRYTKDTLDIYLTLHKQYRHSLVAIQSYLFRSGKDVRKIMRYKGCIRLIKGGYKESHDISYKHKEDTDKNYVKLMKLFLKKGKFMEIATHDENIIDEAKRFVKQHKISKKKFEFEMLYGIRKDLQEQLVREGYRVRVYIPYGKEWFPYYYRRLRERKENFFFMVKHLFKR
jgi:proline dehydrogenase